MTALFVVRPAQALEQGQPPALLPPVLLRPKALQLLQHREAHLQHIYGLHDA